MSGYNKATSDPRRIFNRFLPPTWRNTDSIHSEHNAVISAVADTLEDAEMDLVQSKDESFLSTASGVFLNKWGSYVGVVRRKDETDEHYRNRITKWFTNKKGTVNSLVDNIKEEFENDELEVFIYEPWRNIFYTNRSMLNGVDHLQGHYYRFAVIDIHIGTDVDIKKLAEIVDRYKDAGVMVYFTYENGMTYDASTYDIQLGVSSLVESEIDYTGVGNVVTTFALGQPRSDYTDENLFRTNDSSLNGKDVVSGNPFHAKATYNYAGSGPVDKMPNTNQNLFDMLDSIEEYDKSIYSLTNTMDVLSFPISNTNKTYKLSTLVTNVINSLSFNIEPLTGALTYNYDTSSITDGTRYYVDRALSVIDFKFDKETGLILAYSYQPLTNESTQVTRLINKVLDVLAFHIKETGDISFYGTFDTTGQLDNLTRDLAAIYSFSINQGKLSYSINSTAKTTYLTDAQKNKVIDNLSFTLANGGLAINLKPTGDSELDDNIKTLTFKIVDNKVMVISNSSQIPVLPDAEYSVTPSSYFLFNWDEFIKQNLSNINIDTKVRYIKIHTSGSQYGFNSSKVIIRDINGVDISDNATWISLAGNTVRLENGYPISSPNVSTADYILDLGDIYDLSSIHLGDTYKSSVRRHVYISSGNSYNEIGSVYSTGGDTLAVSSYDRADNKGTWVNTNSASNMLKTSIRNATSGLEISIFDFSKGDWTYSTILPKGDSKSSINLNSANLISSKGYLMVRIGGTNASYDLDYLGFTTRWFSRSVN